MIHAQQHMQPHLLRLEPGGKLLHSMAHALAYPFATDSELLLLTAALLDWRCVEPDYIFLQHLATALPVCLA